MQIERSPYPTWLAREPLGYAAYEHVYGAHPFWMYSVAELFRVLASPDTHEQFVEAPGEGSPDAHAATYWSSLLYLCVYSLGWTLPARGIRWWLAQGRPTPDVRLQLLDQVWYRDGQLDWLLAALDAGFHGNLKLHANALLKGADMHGGPAEQENVAWAAEQQRAATASGVPNPLTSGLHLPTTPLSPPVDTPPLCGHLVRSSPTERRAVLTVTSLVGWYDELRRLGADLPRVGERSWRVQVVAEPLGVLGTYRRSRTTGVWFAGPHQLHVAGN